MLRTIRPLRLALPLALLTALTHAPSAMAKPNADGIEWFKGKLFGVQTNNAGVVRQVVLDLGKDVELQVLETTCETKIADLPHFATAFGKRVSLRMKNGCIDRYMVDMW